LDRQLIPLAVELEPEIPERMEAPAEQQQTERSTFPVNKAFLALTSIQLKEAAEVVPHLGPAALRRLLLATAIQLRDMGAAAAARRVTALQPAALVPKGQFLSNGGGADEENFGHPAPGFCHDRQG
jgi:hypothetical protein